MPCLNSLSNLPKSQPLEGKTAIILTDITAAGLSPAAADTFRFLLGQRIGAIVAVPSRRTISETVSTSQQIHHTFCSAVAATLQSSTADDLQKVSVASAASVGHSTLPDVFSSGCVGDNIIFVNDTFAGHPTAASFIANWNGAVQEVQGFAFGESHTAMWPLAKKTVLIITDAFSDFEAQLSLQTVHDVMAQGAASVHVTVTSPAESNAARIIAGAFKVDIEAQPPVRADSALWKRPISVSFLSSSQKATAITAFNNAFVTAHAFVNDTSSANAHDNLVNIAFSNLRHQAVGLLRRTALVAGDLSGASFKAQRGEEVVAKAWPVKTKRFAFLVDGSIVFNARSSVASASSVATFYGISRVLRQGGNVLLVPASVPQAPVSKQDQDAAARGIMDLLQTNYGVTPSEVVTFTGDDFVPRHLGRSASIFVAFTNGASIHDNIIKSCDVFVRDTTSDEKVSDAAETLLAAARTAFTQIAVGNAAANLSNVASAAGTTSSSILATSASNVSIFTSIISSLTGGPSSASCHLPCVSSLGCAGNSASPESQDMRKPVQGGEGSLLSNVVASTATTILLHPLNLLISPVPNPSYLPLPFLPLRVVHSIAREFIFHGLTKTQIGKNTKALMPGCMASVVAGVASEPFRAIAYGAAGKELASIPSNSFYSSIGDPFTVLSAVAMNLAPQSAFELARALESALQRFVPKSVAAVRNCKAQVAFALNAVARIIICFFLTRVVIARSRYPAVGGILIGGPNARCNKSVMVLYMLREVLALVIETFVQKYFK